jgi:hypothetical protein
MSDHFHGQSTAQPGPVPKTLKGWNNAATL